MTSFFIYASLLTPSEFGQAFIVLAVVQSIGLVCRSLFEDPLVSEKHQDTLGYSSVFWLGLLIGTAFIGGCVVILYIFKSGYSLSVLYVVGMLQVPLVFSSTAFIAYNRMIGRYKQNSQVTVVTRVLGAFSGSCMAFFNYGALSIVCQSLIAELLLFIYFVKDSKIIRPYFSTLHLLKFLRIGWAICVRRLSWDLTVRGIPICLGIVAGPTVVGYFAFAWRLVDMPRSAINSGLNSYVLPILARKRSDRGEQFDTFTKITDYTSIVVIPMFVGISALSEHIVLLMFGEQWIGAVPLLSILALTVALTYPRTFVPTLLTSIGKSHKILIPDLLATCVCLLFVFLGGGIFGATTAGYAMLLRAIVVLLPTFLAIKDEFSVSVISQLRSLKLSLLSSLGLAIVLWLSKSYWFPPNWYQLALIVVLGASSMFLFLFLIQKCWFSDMKRWFFY